LFVLLHALEEHLLLLQNGNLPEAFARLGERGMLPRLRQEGRVMPKCFPMRMPDGGTAIVCGSFPQEKHCVVCGTFATRLCDFKLPSGKTCDAPMCDDHTHRMGPSTDFCPLHKPKESQPALFGPEAA